MAIKILQGDCREVLRTLPSESVHCIVTSPPYWGLRDYGVAGQIGLEPSPDAFVDELVAVFRDVRRVLRSDGTLWLNLGDSYAGGGRCGNPEESPYRKQATNTGSVTGITKNKWPIPSGVKAKDLVGIPWLVAFALRADGWWLRQDIIWSKPNPMPESVTDRCTKAHEYLFLLTKSERYYYDADAIKEPAIYSGLTNQDESGFKNPQFFNGKHRNGYNSSLPKKGPRFGTPGGKAEIEYGAMVSGEIYESNGFRNKRSVWTVPTAPYADAHFATFPHALIEPCIMAGCPKECCAKCGAPVIRQTENIGTVRVREGSDVSGDLAVVGATGKHGANSIFTTGSKAIHETVGWTPTCSCNAGTTAGTVLDPFGGAGTTGLVADRIGRNAIMIELNPEYAAMAERRIKGDAPLFADVCSATLTESGPSAGNKLS